VRGRSQSTGHAHGGGAALFANLTNSMVAHLKFDGNYDDATAAAMENSHRHAHLHRGQSATNACTTSATAPAPASTRLPGVPADLQFGPGQDFSVAFWTRFTALPGNLLSSRILQTRMATRV